MEETKVAVEATGCDKGFEVMLEGAKMAYEADSGLKIKLVAGKDRLPEKFEIPDYIELVTADYTYFSDDTTKRPKGSVSSIEAAVNLHANRDVEAVFAPGDTKGTFRFGTDILRRMDGIKMPAIASHIPFNNVLIDAGANLQSKARHLYQNAIMGHVLAKHYLGVESPLIGIVSVGHELVKGDDLITDSRKSIEALASKGYNIHKYHFEGNCIKNLSGGEVRVTDGKTGNILLKGWEGAVEALFTVLKERFDREGKLRQYATKWGLQHVYLDFKDVFDPRTYAAQPMTGVKGILMIGHGSLDAKAAKIGILLTKKYALSGVNERLKEEIAKYG